MHEFIQQAWPYIAAAVSIALSLIAAGHVVIYKRDSRAAVGWVGLIALAPFIGPLLYFLFGINRIRRKAALIRPKEMAVALSVEGARCSLSDLTRGLASSAAHLTEMARLNERLTRMPLLTGNRVEPLRNGDIAYSAMLEAIAHAQQSITLTTYIFDNDHVGHQFVEALAQAVERGVEVRVLIDSVGARYSIPPVTHQLRLRGVPTARFMPSFLPSFTPYFNLRSHRKILVVDGVTGFTGGMNIRGGNMLGQRAKHPTRDIHFNITGPVVHELQAIFADDWEYTTRETLQGGKWFAPVQPNGPVVARAIPDGPDKNYDKMRMAFHGALAVARHHVRIVTPYFLPDATLTSAINTCALRGVSIDVVLPRRNNLRLVAWAMMAQMWQILEWGCRVWLTPPPFDHSKLLVVDNAWSLIGSANWDPRSLRLNFELGVECYDTELARVLNEEVDQRIATARPLTLADVNGRRLPVKLRDGVARLFAPYL